MKNLLLKFRSNSANKQLRFTVAKVRMTKRRLMSEAGVGDKPITPEIAAYFNLMMKKQKELKVREPLRSQQANLSAQSDKSQVDSSFLQLHIDGEKTNKGRALPGYRWTQEQKLAGLFKWKLSPKAYRAESQLIKMPGVRTLTRMLKDIPVQIGLHVPILDAIKSAIRWR